MHYYKTVKQISWYTWNNALQKILSREHCNLIILGDHEFATHKKLSSHQIELINLGAPVKYLGEGRSCH